MVPNRNLSDASRLLIEKSKGFHRIECDFGAAKGKFLTESAILNPSVFFFGIEGLSARVARANKKIERRACSMHLFGEGGGVSPWIPLSPWDSLMVFTSLSRIRGPSDVTGSAVL